MEDWTVRAKNGKLPTRSVWKSYSLQLWVGMKYGLGSCSSPMEKLDAALVSADFHLTSCLEVVRTIKKEWRYLPSTFCMIEMFDLTTETTVAQLNALLRHYKTNTELGMTITTELELLQLEIGVTGNLL